MKKGFKNISEMKIGYLSKCSKLHIQYADNFSSVPKNHVSCLNSHTKLLSSFKVLKQHSFETERGPVALWKTLHGFNIFLLDEMMNDELLKPTEIIDASFCQFSLSQTEH